MTDLKAYIRQLRSAANELEKLFGFRDGPAAAEEIRKDLNGNGAAPQRGFKYAAGTHWTQTPAGRKHMRKIQKRRYQKGLNVLQTHNRGKMATPKKRHHTGLHWTQKPENKHILAAMIKKSAANRASK